MIPIVQYIIKKSSFNEYWGGSEGWVTEDMASVYDSKIGAILGAPSGFEFVVVELFYKTEHY